MAYVKKAGVKAMIRQLPGALAKNVLPGAAKAAANVVADEARLLTHSDEVRDSIRVRGSSKGGRIVAQIETKGPGAYLAPWEEYGTSQHLIAASDADLRGRSVGRINRLAKESDAAHSLVIGGKFVGPYVMHPGARAHPFLRPALDTKEGEAIAAAQAYIGKRLTSVGPFAPAESEPTE